MAVLKVLSYPDKRLRTKAAPVEVVDDNIRGIMDDMLETMYEAPGIGLAATQVNIHQQIVVIDVSEDKSDPLYLVNPEIIAKSGKEISEEGCLSVPEYYAEVERADKVTVRALGRDGESYEIDAEGLLAVCIQHEMDHLQGKLFVDYLSPLKQQRVRKKLEKMAKQAAA
ncbi:peptide deformylase [Leucothrix pacifica]|uniref:Peptide deformylase n=1 Tax=Leucothrix pacifica TaxID=1247513 RepID=A0A317CPD2_9GAMM|nr:peptide deformylase [Leucothrix pacifica]PWQ99991.1 peptide deformylase [Leucothrix pacifica]